MGPLSRRPFVFNTRLYRRSKRFAHTVPDLRQRQSVKCPRSEAEKEFRNATPGEQINLSATDSRCDRQEGTDRLQEVRSFSHTNVSHGYSPSVDFDTHQTGNQLRSPNIAQFATAYTTNVRQQTQTSEAIKCFNLEAIHSGLLNSQSAPT